MYARVVRFTDVDKQRIEETKAQIESGEGGGPPPGVSPKEIKVVVDESQNTAVVILFFETEEEMRAADQALSDMDAGDTPGTRASIDQGEVRVDAQP
jgi:hypothetical protein